MTVAAGARRRQDESSTLPQRLQRNEDDLALIRAIAGSPDDGPVLMLNLNRYAPAAGFPAGELHRRYISGLEALLGRVGAQILWRLRVLGQTVGEQKVDEVLAVWYPTHRAFLDLASAPGAEENYRLRALCVAGAVIHRCPADGLTV